MGHAESSLKELIMSRVCLYPCDPCEPCLGRNILPHLRVEPTTNTGRKKMNQGRMAY